MRNAIGPTPVHAIEHITLVSILISFCHLHPSLTD